MWPSSGLQPRDQRLIAPHHDAECAVDGGLSGARDRRIGEGDAARGEGSLDLAGKRRRGGAGVDHGSPGRQVLDEAAVAEAHRPHLAARRERQEDQLGCLGERGDGRRNSRALDRESLQRRRVQVVGRDRSVVLAHEIAAHGLAHDAHADKSDVFAAHWSQPSSAKWAAPVPARRPNTAPETRPVPPG